MTEPMTQQMAQSKRASIIGVLRALWNYRRLVLSLVQRDLQYRSSKAIGGHIWLVIQPAMQVLIYTVIFGAVLGAKLPGIDDRVSFGLYLCAGIINWTHFSETIVASQSMFLANADLIKTLRVPRSVLPLTVLLGSFVNYAIIASCFLVALALLGKWPGMVLLSALPLILLQSLLAMALGILSGTVNVFFRDVGQATPVILQLWFWATPIVYPLGILPASVREWLPLNPLYATTVGYQRIVIEQVAPDWHDFVPLTLLSVFLVVLAWGVFRSLSSDIVDEL
jgi:lipopolysaccharide transport system permease protein